MLNPINDTFERVRRAVVPKLGVLVNFYNETTNSDLYVTGTASHNEYVGRVPMPEEEFEQELKRMGFVRNPLASLKTRVGTNHKEEGSFRWLGSNHEDYRDDYQLHVIIYDGKLVPDADTGETYVYAHWEYRWDTNPVKHYKGANWKPKQGIEMARSMLDAHNIEYDTQKPGQ